MTDSNRGPLEVEATALPTEPQPLPIFQVFYLCFWNRTFYEDLRMNFTTQSCLQNDPSYHSVLLTKRPILPDSRDHVTGPAVDGDVVAGAQLVRSDDVVNHKKRFLKQFRQLRWSVIREKAFSINDHRCLTR